MARIAFTSHAAEIVGKLAGSVFQYSYGGWQVRNRSSPNNPQSSYQQLRRGDFGFLSGNWRDLSTMEQASFVAEAGTIPAALDLFIGSNINLILVGQPQITTYISSSIPPPLPLAILSATATDFEVQATGALTVVPTGTALLIFSTDTRFVTGLFLNPSMFSPIAVFDQGTDMATIQNIIAEWNDRYGQLNAGLRVCIKSALIDKSNGLRGPEDFFCINSLIPVTFQISDFNGDPLIDSDGTFVVSQ